MRLRSAFLFQVFGAAVPALLMLMAVPLIRSRLDLEHFAGFTIVLSSVALLALLDGGLGRASTYYISLALTRSNRRRVVNVFHGLLMIGLPFSVLLGLVCAAALHDVDGRTLEIARPALMVLAGFTPVFVFASLLRGFLEAEQRFGRSSSLQLAHGMLIIVAPVVLFSFSNDLRLFAWAVGLARVALMLALIQSCGLMTRSSWAVSRSIPHHAQRVLRYTKWLFLSNLVGLTIVFADRFFVASLFSSSAIAAYLLPMEMIARLQIPVTALCSVLFPRLIVHTARGNTAGISRLIGDAQGAILCAAALAGCVALIVAEPLMRWWLGGDLAPEAARVFVIGIVGLGLIASAALAMLEINSRGLTRPIALLHAVELPLYLALLYLAATASSVALLLGAWIARLAIDAIGMSRIAGIAAAPGVPRDFTTWVQRLAPWSAVAASLLVPAVLALNPQPLQPELRALALIAGVTAAMLAGRRYVARLRMSIRAGR